MSENQKCQKCGAKATTQLKLNDKNKEEGITLILCDACCKAEITCQECKQEIKSLKINQITKSDGSIVRVCEECDKKLQEIKESVQKGRKIKEKLEEYLEDGEHRFDDGTVVKVLGTIKKNLTKEQLLKFKKLLEDSMTGEPSPTNGGKWLGWKRGTPEIEKALDRDGTGRIRQPFCY